MTDANRERYRGLCVAFGVGLSEADEDLRLLESSFDQLQRLLPGPTTIAPTPSLAERQTAVREPLAQTGQYKLRDEVADQLIAERNLNWKPRLPNTTPTQPSKMT